MTNLEVVIRTTNGTMKITYDFNIKVRKYSKTTVTLKADGEITGIYLFAGKVSENNLVVFGVLKQQFGTSDTEGWAHL